MISKRKFRKSLSQNAIYYKVKRVIPIVYESASQLIRVGINLNGNIYAQQGFSRLEECVFWRKISGAAPTGYDVGDIALLYQQYDQVRIAGMSAKWLPSQPNGSSAAASYSPAAVIYDRDGIENDIFQISFASALQDTNAVSIKNVYRPWKKYIKTPKHRINTKIPTPYQDRDLIDKINQAFEVLHGYVPDVPQIQKGFPKPNTNLAGQWHSTESSNVDFMDDSSGTPIYVPRSCHLYFHFQAPAEGPPLPPPQTQRTLGNLVFTSYLVFKDRR